MSPVPGEYNRQVEIGYTWIDEQQLRATKKKMLECPCVGILCDAANQFGP